jgi:hypothetical protein
MEGALSELECLLVLLNGGSFQTRETVAESVGSAQRRVTDIHWATLSELFRESPRLHPWLIVAS